MTDEALLQAWTAGDDAAGAALYRRHVAMLCRFFRSKAPLAWEDLVQSTMLVCLRSRAQYRGGSSFRAFLLGVAHHRLLHHLRARFRDRLDCDGALASIADLDPRPSTLVDHNAERERVAAAMRRIPLELQIALELHYWEGLSTRELAEALAVPQGTIKSRLRRARAALRQVLDASAPARPAASPPLDARGP